MIEYIAKCIDIYIELNIQSKFGRERDTKHTNVIKIKTLFGILYTINKYYFYYYYDVKETIHFRSKGRCSFCERTCDRKTISVHNVSY